MKTAIVSQKCGVTEILSLSVPATARLQTAAVVHPNASIRVITPALLAPVLQLVRLVLFVSAVNASVIRLLLAASAILPVGIITQRLHPGVSLVTRGIGRGQIVAINFINKNTAQMKMIHAAMMGVVTRKAPYFVKFQLATCLPHNI
jgi:hypothetical protein